MTAREIAGLAVLTLPFLGIFYFVWCIDADKLHWFNPWAYGALILVADLSGVYLMTGHIGGGGR